MESVRVRAYAIDGILVGGPMRFLPTQVRKGLAHARELIERERLRHSVLSEAFFALTKVEEELDAELNETPPESRPS
jgi:hypothetical protein